MSFWDLSDGENAKDTGAEYESPGIRMSPIPGNSDVLAAIKAIKWTTVKDKPERYIEAQWQIEQPSVFANRMVFHKLWVDDLDPQADSEEKAKTKRDKARRMLASMDANAGGRLMQSNDMPSDDALSLALVGKQMVIKVMLWERPDSQRPGSFVSGNWVAAVKPKNSEVSIGTDMPTPSKPAATGGGYGGATGSSAGAGGGGFDLDDTIPFN